MKKMFVFILLLSFGCKPIDSKIDNESDSGLLNYMADSAIYYIANGQVVQADQIITRMNLIFPKENSVIKLKIDLDSLKKAHPEQVVQTNTPKNQLNTKGFRKKKDDVNEITYFYPKSAPRYINSRTAFYCYIVQSETCSMRMVGQYVADDWLFVNHIRIKADDVQLDYMPPTVSRDNSGGNVWEWFDVSCGAEELGILRKIAISKQVTVRFIGSDYRHDYKLTPAEIKGIQKAVSALDGL